MVTVERTAEAIIFRVQSTLDEESIKSIEKFISKIEAPGATVSNNTDRPFYEGLDSDGFVNDPVVLAVAQQINRSGLTSLKERFENAPEFAGLFNTEEE